MKRIILALVLGAFSIFAQAATVLFAPDDPQHETASQVAIGIEGLITDGATYNVTFVQGTFTELSTPGNFPFLGASDATASAVMDDIVATLNADAARWVQGANIPFGNSAADTQFFMPFQLRPNDEVKSQRGVAITWVQPLDFANYGTHIHPRYDSIVYATMSAVPIPAAAYLFGSALGLLGWMRRRSI